jgi:hypothetical protein
MFRLNRRKASPQFMMFIGCVILLVGLVWLGRTVNFVRRAERTVGMVTEMKKQTGVTTVTRRNGIRKRTTDGVSYRPIVTFHDKSGNLRQVTESVSSSNPRWKVNDAVKVLYTPEDPNTARIDAFDTIWMFPLITVGMGMLFLVIGRIARRSQGEWE